MGSSGFISTNVCLFLLGIKTTAGISTVSVCRVRIIKLDMGIMWRLNFFTIEIHVFGSTTAKGIIILCS